MERRNGFDRWDAAALAGGMVLGFLSSRVLPPIFAGAAGSARVRFGEDPFRQLEADHRYIVSLLHRMSRASEESAGARAKLLVLFKRALGKHAMAEEDVVYPILYEAASAEEQARQLYDDHAMMKIQLYGLEQALESPATWRERVHRLRDLITPHIVAEEDVEFPRLRRVLAERQHAPLAGRIHREEALVL